MPVLAVFTSKGGAGKTSVATNLIAAAGFGASRLLVELDPQGDAGLILGLRADAKKLSEHQDKFLLSLQGKLGPAESLMQTVTHTWYAAPNRRIYDFLYDGKVDILALRRMLDGSRKKAFTVIDMPPQETKLTLLGLAAADAILVVTTMDETGIAGIARSLAYVRNEVQPRLAVSPPKILGIVQNKVAGGEAETPLWRDSAKKLERLCTEQSIRLLPFIRERRAIRTAQAAHETVWSWPSASDSRNDFINLVEAIKKEMGI